MWQDIVRLDCSKVIGKRKELGENSYMFGNRNSKWMSSLHEYKKPY